MPLPDGPRATLADSSTVEGVLESAIFDAGMMAESNFGDLFKVKWTRNSRTDKGVHSLATVIALRVLLPGDDRWDSDPEGLLLVEQLNQRLPQAVRAFSVQRVNKKFHARRFCFDRTYEYYLPAHVLGIGMPAGGSSAAGTAAALPSSSGGAEGGPPGSSSSSSSVTSPPAGETEAAAAEAARVAEVMGRLRSALALYEGTHPFHNFTLRRREKTRQEKLEKKQQRDERRLGGADGQAADGALGPRPPAPDAAAAVGADAVAGAMASEATATQAAAAAAVQPPPLLPPHPAPASAQAAAEPPPPLAGRQAAADSSAEDDGSDGDAGGDAGAAAGRQGRQARAAGTRGEDDSAGPLEEEDEEDEEETESGESVSSSTAGAGPRMYVQNCQWVPEDADAKDRVTVRHFRSMLSFSADDPVPLVPGGVPCVRLCVRGQSFMLHQIRHMIGAATAVARGMLPLALLTAALAKGARVSTPRAPPHTLILSDCTFPPFRKTGPDEARVARWSGERLQLRPGGQAQLAAFRRAQLDPAINELLSHPDWEDFGARLSTTVWLPEQQAQVLAAHAAWLARREEGRAIRQRREAERAAAAAAAEAAAAAAAATAAAREVAEGAAEAVVLHEQEAACSVVVGATGCAQ